MDYNLTESKESRAPYKEKFWETRLPGDSRCSTKKKVNLRYLPKLIGSSTIHNRGRAFVQAWGDGWVSILCYQKFQGAKRKRKEKKNERKKEKNKMLLSSFWLH